MHLALFYNFPATTDFIISDASNKTRSQHIWQQQTVACQLINLWLTVINSLLDRVTADRHNCDNNSWTLHCSNWLACLDRHEQNCHNLINLLLPARLYTSQGDSCCVKPIAALHLTVDGSTLHIDYTYSLQGLLDLAVWKKCNVIM